MSDQPGVILIEDHPLIRAAQRTLFEDAGYRVTEIATAADLDDFSPVAGEIQAIITDFDLGPGMNGVEVALEIMRRADKRIPTLIVTGGFAGGALAAAAAHGMPVMAKPAPEEEIMAWVGWTLDDGERIGS